MYVNIQYMHPVGPGKNIGGEILFYQVTVNIAVKVGSVKQDPYQPTRIR